MINKCFHSLFYLVLLSCIACSKSSHNDVKPTGIRQKFDSLLAMAKDPANSNANVFADKTIRLAKQTQNDTLLAKAFTTKYRVLSAKNPDSVLPFLKSYCHYSRSVKNVRQLALSQGMIGDYYQSSGKSDSAFFYYTAAKQNFEIKKDTVMAVYRQLMLSGIYLQYNDYIGLESSAAEAMALLNNPSDRDYNPTIYNYLGIAADKLQNNSDADKYYRLAAEFASDSIAKIIVLNNLAVFYNDNGEVPKAETLLRRLNSSSAIAKDEATSARVMSNLGHTLLLEGDPKGIELLQKSEQIRKRINDLPGLVASEIHLAEAYEKTNAQVAERYALDAYHNATKINGTDDRIEALQHVISLGDSRTMKQYYPIYLHLQDSISRVRQSAKNQFAKIKYDFRRFKDDNMKLRAADSEKALELEKRQRHNEILLLTIFLILSVVTLIYFVIRSKHHREKLRQSYLTETRISKIVHDELANEIYHTMAFAETQDLALSGNRESLVTRLDKIYSATRDISREHSTIDTGPEFAANLKETISGYSTAEINVLMVGFDDVDFSAIKRAKKIILYRIVQELLVNMKKHSQCSVAVFSFNKSGSTLNLAYSDNGIGTTTDKKSLKNGLANVESRIHDINGTITFDNITEKGFKVQIAFPI